ncbi:condensation domain-containing protein [Micromonospora pallida]|uniref:condensation domain-containing protein n=1 Tax=Micromonospora pallida TaxID=145854 RepID=UPI00159F3315|nr:condensation domain-containing protein [Micromonospora pallida]
MSDETVSFQEESWLRSLAGQPYGAPTPVHSCWEITGPLDRRALEAALHGAAERHDVLRRSYPTPTGARVTDDVRVWWEVVPEGPEEDVRAAMLAVLRQRFVRAEPPLWRVALTRLGPDRHLLGISLDHLIMDGLSISVLLRSVGELYAAACAAPDGRLAPQAPARPYADFARRQREALAGPWGERRATYWRRVREESGPYPPGCPSGNPDGGNGPAVELRQHIPAEVADPMTARWAGHGVTEFALAAEALLQAFSEVSGTTHTGLVTNSHGRCLPGYLRTPGLFSHGIPVYRAPAAGGTLAARVGALQDRLLETIDHALPLRPVDQIWQEGLVDSGPVAQCVLGVYTARPERDLRLAGLGLRWIDLYAAVGEPIYPTLGTTCFVDWVRNSSGVHLTAQVNPAAFDDTAMDRVLRRTVELVQTGG